MKNGIGLIERKRQGLGRPNIIYVKNFIHNPKEKRYENQNTESMNIENQEVLNSNLQKYEKSYFKRYEKSKFKKFRNHTQIILIITILILMILKKNNTESSDTEIISYPINRGNENNSPPLPAPKGIDAIRWIENRRKYEKLIKKNIDYDIISERYSKAWLDEIVAIMVDVVCSDEPTIRINKQEYPHEVVKSRFLKIDSSHIEYIDFALRSNTSDVRNIRAFLITTIYRSFETADNWFSAKVKHDMANV
ncbi:MAG: DUF6017 domain-containing protein [Clostridiales bacterium]|nr:MAG: DUF6017 domain-containing protein [Clostridiales bacterium]